MSNDKQHGTLVNSNSGVRIPGTVHFLGERRIDFQIDGVEGDNLMAANSFTVSDGWSFEPDPKPLPTEIGSVIQITKWAGEDVTGPEWRAMRTKNHWYVALDRTASYSQSDLEGLFRGSDAYDFEVVL